MFFSIGSLGLLGLLLLRRDDVFSYTLFRNILRQEIGWFDVHNASELSNRLIQDLGIVSSIYKAMGHAEGKRKERQGKMLTLRGIRTTHLLLSRQMSVAS